MTQESINYISSVENKKSTIERMETDRKVACICNRIHMEMTRIADYYERDVIGVIERILRENL